MNRGPETGGQVIRYLELFAMLLLAQESITVVLHAQCTQANPGGCVIAPATTEINLAALPVDHYSYGFPNNGTIPSCSASTDVRTCIRNILNNYHSQGATGVRFLFGLGGGGHSTPFAPNGGVYTCWLARLNDFLADAAAFGYTKVTPTPVLVDPWSAVVLQDGSCPYCTDRANVTSCGAPKTLRFFPWLPFGLDVNNSLFPDCQGNNNGYNMAVANTYNWWGWNRYFRLLDFVFQKVAQNNLTIADFDMQNEVDLLNFTVEGRLIYDRTQNPEVDVLGTIRQKMVDNFGSGAGGRVTFSTQMSRPSLDPLHPDFDCGSFYGDSAMIVRESERLAGFGNALVGTPANLNVQNNLPCGGTSNGMIQLGVLYSQPTLINIHAHVCYEGNCNTPSDQGGDATPVAKNLYNDVWTYLQVRGLTGNKVMFGEVNHTQGSSPLQACDGYYKERAFNNVNGFIQSTLFTSTASSNTVLRVWQNPQSSCYIVPNTIKPPYGPP